MALTSNDETDLLLPLYRGVMETPHFSQFLDRLKRRTGAAHVSITWHRADAPVDTSGISYAGTDLRPASANHAGFHPTLRPYRVYTLADLGEQDAAFASPQIAMLAAHGITDVRIVRIPVSPDVNGMLMLARNGPCSAADSALLSNLAPYVETALAALQAMERSRFETNLSAQSLTRSGTGWILFDADARILSIEPATRQRLLQETGIEPRVGEHLRAIDSRAERKLVEAAARFAEDSGAHAETAVFRPVPRIDAVLTAAPGAGPESGAQFPHAAMIAYCRFETAKTAERSAHLASLFDLPAREAELAIALADGYSIAEAAAEMGLTLETARNYSKRLYAQLGVRGQAELVRLIHRSSAMLA